MADRVYDILIVGGGQGGHQTAESLRAGGYAGSICIAGTETRLPYQQPPLSKAFLSQKTDGEKLAFRNAEFYRSKAIDLHLGQTAVALDVAGHKVKTGNRTYRYQKLVLATGATPRRLPVEGADLDGILTLRTLDDARVLRDGLSAAGRLVIIGAGFIGLEVASTALALGLKVSLVEAADRVMARAVSPALSDFFQQVHTSKGLDLRLETAFKGFEGGVKGGGAKSGGAKSGAKSAVSAVVLANGGRIGADLVLMGIGATPNDGLAKRAGLACANGIVVNAQTQTSDPDIYAIGDCSNHPNAFSGGMFRLESVQNAIDQGKTAAAHICGQDVTYKAVPWFWSDQHGHKLQMAGLPKPDALKYEAGDKAAGVFTVSHFEGDALTGVEAVNLPAEQMAARQLIGTVPAVSLQEVQDAGSLKGVLLARRKAAKAPA